MGADTIRFDENTAYTREWLLDNEDATQAILAKYKAQNIQPHCECSSHKPQMYIAKRNRYYLARNPGTGALHTPNCPSFEVEDTDSGKMVYENGVIRNNNDGSISVKLLSPLSHAHVERPQRLEQDLDAKAPPPVRNASDKREAMSLSGLLALLWETAELNRWIPGFAGKRYWFIVRKRLLEAAESMTAKRMNLAEVLYIPEHFHESSKNAIEQRRKETFTRIMKTTRSTVRYMVTLGRIRKISLQDETVAINLGHLDDNIVFWGGKHIVRRIERTPVMDIMENDELGRSLFTIMVVRKEENESLSILDIGFMTTDHRFLPQYTQEDHELTDKLVEGKRTFIKSVRYDAHKGVVTPEYLLTDVGEQAIPMAIFRPFASETELQERHNAQIRWKEQYGSVWIWDVVNLGSKIPDLPVT